MVPDSGCDGSGVPRTVGHVRPANYPLGPGLPGPERYRVTTTASRIPVSFLLLSSLVFLLNQLDSFTRNLLL
jgi:hypothetical protein